MRGAKALLRYASESKVTLGTSSIGSLPERGLVTSRKAPRMHLDLPLLVVQYRRGWNLHMHLLAFLLGLERAAIILLHALRRSQAQASASFKYLQRLCMPVSSSHLPMAG